jgi:quercetin dioxygenase-like cupin family protein
MAKSKVLIENDKTIVTEWLFEVGDSTGHHIHKYNYIVVPMLDGELKIIDKENNETISKLTQGGAYYKDKGVEHNVFNNNSYPYSFIEIEILK